MLSAGRSPERAHTETFPPAFLFSHQMPLWGHLLTASPRGKRQALTRRCVSYLVWHTGAAASQGTPYIKGKLTEGIKAAIIIWDQLVKLEFSIHFNDKF